LHLRLVCFEIVIKLISGKKERGALAPFFMFPKYILFQKGLKPRPRQRNKMSLISAFCHSFLDFVTHFLVLGDPILREISDSYFLTKSQKIGDRRV